MSVIWVYSVYCMCYFVTVIFCNMYVCTYIYCTTYIRNIYTICYMYCVYITYLAAKLVPLAYGIKKLQITCVIEDDKIGTDFLEESITAFEDLVCMYVRTCVCMLLM